MPANVNDTDVTYFLVARDGTALAHESARSQLKKTEDASEKTAGAMKTHWESFRKHWLEVTASFYAAYKVIQQAWNMAEMAAQFEEQKRGLDSLAAQYGMTADQIIKATQKAVDGQLSMVEASQLASRAMLLSLNPKQIIDFIGYAERLTDVAGGEIPAAFEAMERAAATGRSKGLVQYGIVIDLNKALEEYARKHGIAKDRIDEHTAMQVRANAILEEAKKKTDQMGEAQMSVADKMNVLKATVKDIELWLGQIVIRAAAGATGAFQLLSGGLFGLMASIEKTMAIEEANAFIFSDPQKAAAMIQNAKNVYAETIKGQDELFKKASANFDIFMAKTGTLAAAMAQPKPPGGGGKTAAEKANPELTAFEEAEKANAHYLMSLEYQEAIRKAIDENHEAQKKADDEDIKRILAKNEEEAQISQAQYDAMRLIDDAYLEEKRQKEEKAAKAEMDLKSSVVNNAVTLLMMLGEKSKAAAVLGIAISTAVEMVRAWQTAIVASELAAASQLIPGDPTSLVRAEIAAAAMMTWGKANLALIAASGALRIGAAMAGGGEGGIGASSGGGYNPNSNIETTYARNQELKPSKTINVHIYGNVVDNDKFARDLIESIRKAEEDNVH
jgi:hypothetical protein